MEDDMKRQLTLGTARITAQPNYILLEYMNGGSFLIAERIYSTISDALTFCAERKICVIETVQ